MNLSTYPTSALVTAFNALTGASIKKFENRTKAETRVAAALTDAGLSASAIEDIIATGALPKGSVSTVAAAEVSNYREADEIELSNPEDIEAAAEMHDEIVGRLAAPDDFEPPAFLTKGKPSLADIAAAVEAPAAGRDTPGLRRLRANASASILAEEAKADQARAAAEAERERAAIERETAAKAAPTPRAKLLQTQRIVAVVDNPKKPGSRSHARFSLYREGATVREFIAACEAAGFPAKEAMADLSWDRRHKFISIE